MREIASATSAPLAVAWAEQPLLSALAPLVLNRPPRRDEQVVALEFSRLAAARIDSGQPRVAAAAQQPAHFIGRVVVVDVGVVGRAEGCRADRALAALEVPEVEPVIRAQPVAP